ncbi:Alkyl hydroperoxide reductase subunit C/ Thiol specific antioxidant [Kalmanozyma brasiliensis GHG001]|uniref:thioredoxin-dependent peroxiredoxin n=1 Tax=Kalmanozyma brasiliensis (strain GHG001) TaxID=1365824 RepID=V5GS04_KALBG|nr:Alkyl hydroperoxide reductase subunit C/ Thiol specific antioxidant [Kalmanozyma brasiliensis GHG001]EST08712.1 Alkyl hydroperoxide reductase subunit C/ Thiol specific antioxidant [Kalmanozyma brasiliensis GHG001]
MSGEAPRRSARNAGKPAPSAPAPAPAAAKRKSAGAPSGAAAEKKAKPAASKPAAVGQLKVGDALPSFKLKLQDGKEIDTATLKNAVLFSYPRANTSGCTTQAKLYRDNHASFTSSSYTVYGLSNDSPTSLSSWKDKQKFPYDLISDPQRKLIKALTGSDDKTRRSHFVVDKQGKLAFVELSVKPVESWESALEFVQKK